MIYLRVTRVGDQNYYSVYNSLGQLALYTSHYGLARSCALSFERDTSSVYVVVRDAVNKAPARRL